MKFFGIKADKQDGAERRSLLWRVSRWTLLAGCAVVLLIIIVPRWVVARDIATSGKFTPYLEEHVQKLDLSRPDVGLVFDDLFYDNQLFLLGEIHGAQRAQTVDLAFMRHLNQRAGVRYLMAELDYSQAERFNAYLDSGDESFITPVFTAWDAEVAQWGNQQHFEKLRSLRAYNETLPESQRLRYFGVDRIQNVPNAVTWLERMMTSLHTSAPEPLLDLKACATNYDGDLDALREATAKAVDFLDDDIGDSSTSSNDPEKQWGIDALAVRHLTRNLHEATKEDVVRYDMIMSNIDEMVNTFGIGDDEKLYGFWGIFHVLRTTVNETARPMALRLEESDLPFAQAIVSLSMVYTDSEQNMPSQMLPKFIRPEAKYFNAPMSQDNPYLAYIKGIYDLKHVAGNADAAVFKLDAPDSPYSGTDRLVQQTGLLTHVFRFEMTVSDRVPASYVVLVNGSSALTPYTG